MSPRIYIFFFLILCLLLGIVNCSHHRGIDLSSQKQKFSTEAQTIYYYLKYLDLLKKNKNQQAIEALKKATRLSPAPELFIEQANYYYQKNNDLDQVYQVIEKGLNFFPNSQKLFFSQIEFYLENDQLNQAQTSLKNFLQKYPDNKKAQIRLAKIFLKKELYPQAIDVLKQIPDAEKNVQTHYLLAKAYSGQDNRKNAIYHLKKTIDQDPSFLKAWAELAYQYELTKDFVAAEKTYTKLLDKGLTNQSIYLRLIDLNLKLNKPEKALKLANKGLGDYHYLIEASSLFIQNSFYNQGEVLLNSLSPERQNLPNTLYLKAIISEKAHQKTEQALKLLQQIDPTSSLYSESLILQTKLLLRQDKKDQALEKAKKGQKNFPHNSKFWLLESDILRLKKQFSKAKEVLQQGLDYLPKNTDLLFQLGALEYELDNKDDSLKIMEKIIKIDPDHAQALNFVGYTLTERGQDLDRALILIKKALKMEPENGYFLDSLAWLYFKTGKLKKAWETISAAVNHEKEDPIIWEHFGDIANSLNKKQKAKMGYKKALRLNSKHNKKIQRKLKKLTSQSLYKNNDSIQSIRIACYW